MVWEYGYWEKEKPLGWKDGMSRAGTEALLSLKHALLEREKREGFGTGGDRK